MGFALLYASLRLVTRGAVPGNVGAVLRAAMKALALRRGRKLNS
jgi:hypothetical protein